MSPEDFIFARAMPEPNSGCWLWLLKLDKNGYGSLKKGGRSLRAHRYVYESLVAPIPEDHEIDHLCRNRCCCNPQHLEVVTQLENIRRRLRSDKVGKYRLANTLCPHGHPYSGNNVRIAPSGQRVCRACARENMRRYRAPEKATKTALKLAATAAKDEAIRAMIIEGFSVGDICGKCAVSPAYIHRRFQIRSMRKRRPKAIHVFQSAT